PERSSQKQIINKKYKIGNNALRSVKSHPDLLRRPGRHNRLDTRSRPASPPNGCAPWKQGAHVTRDYFLKTWCRWNAVVVIVINRTHVFRLRDGPAARPNDQEREQRHTPREKTPP
ncbi:unnamed protein product, partial [Ectocarpus sp. 12 AP-2014]